VPNLRPIITPDKKMPKINVSCQNVCSLNISKPGRKTYSKLISVTKSESDVIFLCDTRLNCDLQIVGVNDIKKKLGFLGYSFFHNSTRNSRGTAILISNKLLFNIEDVYKDGDCNILMLKIKINETNITLGSIYGPNHDDEDFFNNVKSAIDAFSSDYVLIGGDWNTTYDSRNSRANIDILNNVNIPSLNRSIWLNRMSNDARLIDPYRYLYPDVREYTYTPFAAGAMNRSRLDFF
jgi:exonuclease III